MRYSNQIMQFREDLEELQERIIDSQTRATQIKTKLVELRKSEKKTDNPHKFKSVDVTHPQRHIMVGSILSVHIINAEDLDP